MTKTLALLLLVVSGCFFAGDDDGDCLYEATGAPFQAYELRDPATGVCAPYGDAYPCNDACGPCAQTGAETAPIPDWAQCYAACEGLAEDACKTTGACRAAYNGSAFYQCWGVAPSGPVQDGGCAGLDAYGCSQHDDCVAVHAAGINGAPIGNFSSCMAEGTVQDPGSCVGAITCASVEPACPDGTIAGRRNGCWTGYCIPYAQCDVLPACGDLDEMECVGRTDCSPIYEGQNCTCNGSACTCQSWTFDSCKTM